MAGVRDGQAIQSSRLVMPGATELHPLEALLTLVPRGASVLDAGCGQGQFLSLLARHGRIASGVGFDVSGLALEAARSARVTLGSAGEALCFERADALGEWPVGRFGVVAAMDLLSHLPRKSRQAVVASAVSRLAGGGRVILMDRITRPRWKSAKGLLRDLVTACRWRGALAPGELAGWCSAAGLTIERSEKLERGWSTRELVVARKP